MPTSSSKRTLARRALVEDIRDDKKSWLRHGVAALAVSILGLGVAGSVALTGAAQHTTWTATVATTDLAKQTSRGAETRRTERALDPARVRSIADQREEELGKINAEVSEASMDKSAKAREKALEAVITATRRQAVLIQRGQAARSDPQAPFANAGPVAGAACLSEAGTASLPASASSARGRATTRAWTSPLPSAPHCTLLRMGSSPTPGLDLPAAGPATMSRSSMRMAPTRCWRICPTSRSAWARLSSACENVGAVGLTGRTFGAHVHFEVYPAGVAPGDIYRAVNPVSVAQGPRSSAPSRRQSFSRGAYRSDRRLSPEDPKSTSAIALSPSPEVATTVPMPKVVCSTLSPATKDGISRMVGFAP